MFRKQILASIAGGAALLTALVPGLASADVPKGQIPASLHAAIEQHIESRGHPYAGLCVDVNALPQPPFGQYCSFVLSIEHDIAEVSYGPVASNDITRVAFDHNNGTWTLRGSSQPPPTQPAPTQPVPSGPTVPAALGNAIRAYIESRGHQYAGLCVDVNSMPNMPAGKYCAAVTSIEHDIAEVVYGPVLSDELSRVSFDHHNGTWTVRGSQARTPTQPAPTQPAPTQPPPSGPAVPAALGNAIRAYIESRGHQYAGLCVDVNAMPQLPFGKYCAFVLSIEHGIAEVTYGPVASDALSRVSFRLENGQWKLYSGTSQPQTGETPRPPSTGSGDVADSDDGGFDAGLVLLTALVGGMAIAAGAAGFAYRSR